MLIKITEDKYLNADYIIVFLLIKPGKRRSYVDITDQINKVPITETSYQIVAKMIDNSNQLLLEFQDEKKARQEFARLLRESNKRIKSIQYE